MGFDFVSFFLKCIYFMFMSVLAACTPTYHKKASELILDSYKPPCGCWELNSAPLEEQSVLLIARGIYVYNRETEMQVPKVIYDSGSHFFSDVSPLLVPFFQRHLFYIGSF